MVAFVTEALVIAKQIFLSSKSPLEKIGAFYLLYALYFKQPTDRFCKVRVTLRDWREFKRFVQWPAPEQYSLEIAAIFWKMFIGDAFRFVQHELEQGYDSFFGKGTALGRFDDKCRESFKIVKEAEKDFLAMKASTGLFTALDALEMGYNEMKESLDGKFWGLFIGFIYCLVDRGKRRSQKAKRSVKRPASIRRSSPMSR